jgi:tRNA (guanine37-N1)-methyltransferase
MRFDIITLFPDMLQAVLDTSILKRAQAEGHVTVHLHDLRQFGIGKHKQVDDTPYGGGAGMLLKVDVMTACLNAVEAEVAGIAPEKRLSLLLCPQGERFVQETAEGFAELEQITLVCGHYEGFDERIRSLVDGELSIGDFVLTGGELPALMVVDAVSRLVPGVITKESPEEESFSLKDTDGNRLLEYPHYTRPVSFNGSDVPEVLLSGNHAAIAQWRMEQAKMRTKATTKKPTKNS